jgi:hypothetical protein
MNVHASRPESGFLARYPPAFTSERLEIAKTTAASSSFTSSPRFSIAFGNMFTTRTIRAGKPTISFLLLTLRATIPSLAQTPEPFEVRRAEAVFGISKRLKASQIAALL